MSIVVNEVRRATYLDSVALMRISRTIAEREGVEEAGLMIGTEPNKQILREAGVLGSDGETAAPGDLIVAVRAVDAVVAKLAIAAALALLDQPRRSSSTGNNWRPRTLQAALRDAPDANLALISVPGAFATGEARKALQRGLHVMMFSDNVPIDEEVELKKEAKRLGLLVMGPDCGTAIIGGVPLAFANVVPQGDIGIIGASGTGVQEVSCLIAQAGRGISHAIGTGGRDLKAEVGAITTLMAIDALDSDAATRHIVLISKPPAKSVADVVLARVARSAKPFTVCFLGAEERLELPRNARPAPTLEAAAASAVGRREVATGAVQNKIAGTAPGKAVRGLFAGGTLCSEAQIVLLRAGLVVHSNIPVPGAIASGAVMKGHVLLDLGDDDFTRGRPHPMIEPAVRDAALAQALADPSVGAVLVDCVLGYGGHLDPAGHLANSIAGHGGRRPAIIGSVTGTQGDPQGRADQVRKLEAAGVVVCSSNAAAARIAADCVRPAAE